MNFTEYCIYTKNYSSLNTIKEYQKLFNDYVDYYVKDDNGDYSDMIVPALAAAGGGIISHKLIKDFYNDRIKKAKRSGDNKQAKTLEMNKNISAPASALAGSLAGFKLAGGVPKLRHHIHSGDKIVQGENEDWHYESND